jgi:hypothetical protein
MTDGRPVELVLDKSCEVNNEHANDQTQQDKIMKCSAVVESRRTQLR